ncbi:efflux RND transporter periplasmic adaptor subunit [Arenibacter sp. GZD96]|uniref:efflux RND transporter periplasmic adaptor subunit n=1 Tax=Aurantibrevibacter litoralis TaxID=3106030 RepID=UPI002AFFFAA4|nr:efflux RND transporter periplasmic adaptor subunit [Arenibacter sp. GZD-96]MEA1785472.1 efflux RND transporter periplasmic adaptor subunit [Arenibacter sp. GZD-96]
MSNEIKKISVIAGLTLVLGLFLGWIFFGGSNASKNETHLHTTEIGGESIWTCSMHPQIRKSEAGSCPICGMDLIPISNESENEQDPMAISMSPAAMKMANVSTAVVSSLQPVKELRLNGKVQADERSVFSQVTHIPGRIERLMVNFTGEYITKGQVIASLYSPDVVIAQEELFETQKLQATQPQLFNAAKEKLRNWKLSERQIEQLLVSGQAKEEFSVYADVSGYVTEKKVNLGDYVSRGMPIYEVANLSTVWVLFDIYESDLVWIKKGDKINFTVQSLPGETFQGAIDFLDPVINASTRVVQARVQVPNKDLKLKPEMFASGTLASTRSVASNNAIIVPKTAVMWTGKRSVVYVKQFTSTGISFRMREVTLGASLGDGFIIESGLKEGDEIAINGTFSIDAAAQLAGKPSMMNPEGGATMTGHDHGGINEQIPVNHKKEMAVSADAKKAMEPLFEAYLTMKDALTNDQMKDAKKAGTTLLQILNTIDARLFQGASHEVWMRFSNDLSKTLTHVQHFSTIEELRNVFQHTSNLMIELSQTVNPLSKTLYVQHCPMADSNKGANWLSLSDEIKNPYFGKAMATCGEITNQIN